MLWFSSASRGSTVTLLLHLCCGGRFRLRSLRGARTPSAPAAPTPPAPPRDGLPPAPPRHPGAQPGKGPGQGFHFPDPAALVAVFQALPEGEQPLASLQFLDRCPRRKVPFDPDAQLAAHRLGRLVRLLVDPAGGQGEDPRVGKDVRHHGDENDILHAETRGKRDVRVKFGQGPPKDRLGTLLIESGPPLSRLFHRYRHRVPPPQHVRSRTPAGGACRTGSGPTPLPGRRR